MPWESQFDGDAFRAMVHAAEAEGIRVAAHAHGVEAVRRCVDAGVDTIEHCTFMTADGVEHDPALLHQLSDSGVVVRITPGPVPGGPPPPPAMAPRMTRILHGLTLLWQAGARIAVSTDAGVGPGKPHDAMAYAAIQFGNAIGDAVGALRASTAFAADALGLTGTCGRLTPGYTADALVVRGDPTTDLGALLEVEAVYRDGEQVAGHSSRIRPPGGEAA